MKKPKPYDQAFKYLAEEDPRALLVLLGALKPGQKARIKLLPNEVTVSAKLPDSTYQVTLENGEQRLVHIESQTVYDPLIQSRMAEYAMRLWIKYGLPVDSYLLLLTPRKVPTPIPHQFHLRAGGLEIRLRYQVVPLWRLSARQVRHKLRKSRIKRSRKRLGYISLCWEDCGILTPNCSKYLGGQI